MWHHITYWVRGEEREGPRLMQSKTHTHTNTRAYTLIGCNNKQQHGGKQTGRPDECRLDSSVFSTPLCIPCSSLKYNEAPLISAGMRVIAGAETQWWFPVVLVYQANTCWPVELADTTGYDIGEEHGCRSRRQ